MGSQDRRPYWEGVVFVAEIIVAWRVIGLRISGLTPRHNTGVVRGIMLDSENFPMLDKTAQL